MAIDGQVYNNDQSTINDMAALGTLPIVRETTQQPVWQLWDAAYRDVFVLDRDGGFFDKINLTDFNPDPTTNSQNYAQLKAMFVSADTVGTSTSHQDQAFVASLYQDVLGRPADQGGLEFHTNVVSSAREAVLPQTPPILLDSAEYRNNLIGSYYDKFLGRTAGAGDLAYWGTVFQDAGAEQVIASITGSDEYFVNHGGSNIGWLQAIYPDILGRPLDQGGQTYWLGILQSGAGRSDAALSMATSTEARNSLVDGFYTQLLKRSAGPADMAYWVGQLAQGQRDEQILAAIASSKECFQKSGDTITGWVTTLYQAILKRTPDAGGLNFFEHQVLAGYAVTRQGVASGFANSDEYRRRVTTDYYQQLLGRAASEAEKAAWQELRKQLTDEQQVEGIVASSEYFQNAGGTNDTWLDRLYPDLLGRPRDAGAAGFLNALNNGTTSRQQVAAAILGSGEYRTRLIDRYYSSYLARPPVAAETAFWNSVFSVGGKDEDVISQILATTEYARAALS